MNTKKYRLSGSEGKKSKVYQIDRNGVEKKIGDGFVCQTGKVIVVGVRTKDKMMIALPFLEFPQTGISLVLGHAILHDEDADNPSVGIHIAIKRAMKQTKTLNTLNYRMLNDGFCQAIVNDEARHITENIKDYYKEYQE
jgi:hypothetical protein